MERDVRKKIPKSVRFGEYGGILREPHPGFAEIADRIGVGDFLMYLDIREIFERNKLKTERISDLRFAIDSGRLSASTGIQIRVETYKARSIFYNPALDPDVIEQGLQTARQRIDEAMLQDAKIRLLSPKPPTT